MIAGQKATVGLNKGAAAGGHKDGPRGSFVEPRDTSPTLAEAGIDKKLSARARVRLTSSVVLSTEVWRVARQQRATHTLSLTTRLPNLYDAVSCHTGELTPRTRDDPPVQSGRFFSQTDITVSASADFCTIPTA